MLWKNWKRVQCGIVISSVTQVSIISNYDYVNGCPLFYVFKHGIILRVIFEKPVPLQDDNARPYSFRQSAEHLNSFKREIFNHPPYSPDLAPANYHFFTKLKGFLGSLRFKIQERRTENWHNYVVEEFGQNGVYAPYRKIRQ